MRPRGAPPDRPRPPPPLTRRPPFPVPAGAGVTYDLSSMQQQLQRIDDNRNETTSTWYDYWFSVCSDLGASPGGGRQSPGAAAARRPPAGPRRRR